MAARRGYVPPTLDNQPEFYEEEEVWSDDWPPEGDAQTEISVAPPKRGGGAAAVYSGAPPAAKPSGGYGGAPKAAGGYSEEELAALAGDGE